jgi:predicted nucleotidyltransferase
MLAGYNQRRPTKENYEDFLSKLVSGLRDFEGLSLMLYGSHVRGDSVPGRSDIDAVLITPDDVVMDKKRLEGMAHVLNEALKGNPVPFQVTLSDLATMKDGRFNSYNSPFREYFEQEGLVIVGPDYKSEFNYSVPEHPEQGSVTFNLRKARQGLLFAEHDRATDYELFLRRFNKTLDAASRGSKQILFMNDGNLRKNRFSALDEIPQVFPSVDVEPLRRIKHLYHHLDELDRLYTKPTEVMALWNSSVTFFEQMIQAYLKGKPHT